MYTKITTVHAREILDSRGNPIVMVRVGVAALSDKQLIFFDLQTALIAHAPQSILHKTHDFLSGRWIGRTYLR
jgi:hypothetical protein